MPANILKHEKFHSIGVDFKSPTLEKLKQDVLDQVLNLKPILARHIHDHLLKYDEETSVVEWKKELLEQMQIGDLTMLRNLLENRMEQQQRTY